MAHYGESYFETRANKYGYIPIWDHHWDKADGLTGTFVGIIMRHESEKKWGRHHAEARSRHPEDVAETLVSSELAHDLWDIMVHLPWNTKSRVMNALPQQVQDIPRILDVGTKLRDDLASRRDLGWLEENGKCMDNIRPDTSRIPQAGRGAFATRFIPEGGLVSPAPLIHIHDRSLLDMYFVGAPPETDDEDEQHGSERSEYPVHRQLMLNYCFGHNESTLLLCPYGMFSSFINHAPSGEEPNARIVWSDYTQNPEWLDQPIETFASIMSAGLAFDFVATRDILPGEEVTIDYGSCSHRAVFPFFGCVCSSLSFGSYVLS